MMALMLACQLLSSLMLLGIGLPSSGSSRW
jgi:hypothetical protein